MDKFFESGKKLLSDTKQPKKSGVKKGKTTIEEISGQVETDPHRIFVKRCVSEKPKKVEIVKDIKRFIEVAEAQL